LVAHSSKGGAHKMKIATIRQSDLDSSCWLVQFWGRSYCQGCKYNGTKECGGNWGNAKRIKEGKMKPKSKPIKPKTAWS